MNVLQVAALSVRYGGVRALSSVNVEVRPGELVGLIGPNGAGKTTFIDAVTGFARSEGRVLLDGRDVSSLRPHKRARAGLARTFQAAELFGDLTVRENIAVPVRQSLAELAHELVRGRPGPDENADIVLQRLGLTDLADALPEVLTQAQRNLVGLGRALAASPRLLCLDEPAAGLDTADSAELGDRLRSLADDGQAILLVDHDMGLVLAVCDRIVVLDFGRVIATGIPAEIEADPVVRTAYLGTEEPEPPAAARPGRTSTVARQEPPRVGGGAPLPSGTGEQPVLELVGLSAGYYGAPVVRGLDLVVHAGEVVALLGPNGAGKTTTLRAISRMVEPIAGQIRYQGADIAGTLAHRLARRGLVHVPDDRGIFFGLTVAEHFRAAPGGPLELASATDYFPELGLLRDRRVGLLSGGEQQMLALALALVRKPRMLLLDELSMGLAPVIVQRMLPVVRAYASEQRAGVLLVEQHVPLALGVADRACVLAHGSLVLDGDAAELRNDQDLLLASYLGEPPVLERSAHSREQDLPPTRSRTSLSAERKRSVHGENH